ncbi:hypothetical protein [Halobaculum limi]|uniref:hypothetical protein n=1 Tax=Halobaculum limi TaxID=3031916 RepID=UPI002407500E|nr:hypothetical protein [Halobaculum sp. YSMS11]
MIDALCHGPWGGFASIPGSPPSVYEAAGIAVALLLSTAAVVATQWRGTQSLRRGLATVGLAFVLSCLVVVSGRIECPHGYTGLVSVTLGAASGLSSVGVARRLQGHGSRTNSP